MWHTGCAVGSFRRPCAIFPNNQSLKVPLLHTPCSHFPHDSNLPYSAGLLEDEVRVDGQLVSRTSVSFSYCHPGLMLQHQGRHMGTSLTSRVNPAIQAIVLHGVARDRI